MKSLSQHVASWARDMAWHWLGLDVEVRSINAAAVLTDAHVHDLDARLRVLEARAPHDRQACSLTGCIDDWVLAACIEDDSTETLTADLHRAYVSWCRSARMQPLNVHRFARCLSSRGIRAGRNSRHHAVRYLKLKEVP